MKDNDLRGLVLQKYYEKRREDLFQWTDDDFKDLPEPWGFDAADLWRICDQLGEHGLTEWHPASDNNGRTIGGIGKISAFGVDVIEGTTRPPIAITIDHSRHVSVQDSVGVQIGDGNIQDLSLHIGKIVSAIDHSTASDQQKAEAKSLLKRFLEHPLVASIVGGIAANIKLQ